MQNDSRRIAFRFLGVLLAFACPLSSVSADEDPDTSLPPALLDSSPLGEKLELIRPELPRDEKLQDRLHAASLFAHGRLLQNREDYAGALQRFQRAWRYHPQQVSILDAIVPLAFELQRHGEAARYAVISAERNPQDVDLLRRLATYLTQKQDYKRAAGLYERALQLDPPEKSEPQQLEIRMDLGRLYLLLEDYPKSAAAFLEPAQALENPKEYKLTEESRKALLGEAERTYQMFGESFVRAGMLDQAEQAFRKANQAEPNQPLLDYSLARIAAGKNQPQQALELLDKYFAANQSVAGLEPYELYADLVSQTSENEQQASKKIIDRLQTLHANDPANAALGIFLAGRLAADQQLDAAEKVYQGLLEVSPSLESYNGLIALQRDRRQIPGLLDALGQAVARAGDFDPLEESTAEILQDQELMAELLQEAERRRTAGSGKLGAGVALAAGLLAIEAEAYEQVKPLMTIALEEGVPAKSAIVLQWGLGLLMADQAQAAAEVFQMALDKQIDPENEAAYYYYLASALGMGGHLDKAIEAAERAVALRPLARFKSRIPLLYYYAKQNDKAEQAFQQLLDELDDQYDEDIREVLRDARLVLSTIALKQGNFERAVEFLERVLDEYPEDIGAKNDLGYLWADENIHLQRAHAMLREAVAAQPDNLAYRDSLGWVLFRLGRTEEALVELELAAAEDDPDGVILDHLADALWAAGKHERAKQIWQRAIAAFEQSEEPDSADEVRRKLSREP